jgi:hypothetical protein
MQLAHLRQRPVKPVTGQRPARAADGKGEPAAAKRPLECRTLRGGGGDHRLRAIKAKPEARPICRQHPVKMERDGGNAPACPVIGHDGIGHDGISFRVSDPSVASVHEAISG